MSDEEQQDFEARGRTCFQVVPLNLREAIDGYGYGTKLATVIHGCNCHKIMGAGVAAWVRSQLPEAFWADRDDQRTPKDRFGSFSKAASRPVWLHEDQAGEVLVYNLYSQYSTISPDNPHPFCLSAFREGLTAIFKDITARPVSERYDGPILMPCIGAGLGGGDWLEIQRALLGVLRDFNRETPGELDVIVCQPIC
jgi:hypothetical protein